MENDAPKNARPDTWCCSTVSYCLLIILLGSWIMKRDSAVIFIQYHRNATQEMSVHSHIMACHVTSIFRKMYRAQNSNTQISSQTKNTMMIYVVLQITPLIWPTYYYS